ncbi:MAG TPA: methyltransferase domain-containing protein [Candidatus Dormibacteraeota bacterium]|nr:methyltransferase domain-containing protein [Candidatus Dormibacteraeota bacterium]
MNQQRESVDNAYQSLLEQLAEVSRLRDEDRAELTGLAARVRDGARAATATPASESSTPSGGTEIDIDGFYSGFEERFRGSREDISARLAAYLPDVVALRGGDAALLDVGPGRCEWLELLSKEGIPAYGVDTNARFVDAGTALGLDVRHGDAIAHLRGLPDRCLIGVTAFQVVEHLPTNLIFDMVDHALRVLRPGGIMILETPNPLNLVVGAADFWMDPTHLHPLHPRFLEYLLINRGFAHVEVRMANSPEGCFDTARLDDDGEMKRVVDQLNGLLYSGRDYAVLGWRAEHAG